MLGPLLALALAGDPSAVGEAERLAAEAIREAARNPETALGRARRALGLTADFEPTAFVEAGRRGEVLEDVYLEARRQYRRHRSRLYEAVGECLARQGGHEAAVRYLRRAVLLDPAEERVFRLARSLLALRRGEEALETLHAHSGRRGFNPVSLALVEQATDAAGLPSAQIEIDRARLRALPAGPVAFREGPLRVAAGTRLSTGEPARLDEGITLLYPAEASCRSCSEDLQAVERSLRPGVRVVLVPASADEDRALRQVLALYRYDWPLLLGRDAARGLGLEPRSALVVGRGGWAGAVVRPPLQATLARVLEIFSRADLKEPLPRPGWEPGPRGRAAAPAPPALLTEGLAPGEDEPAPEEFRAAVAAYRAGRAGEALRLFERLEARGDGWLLGPEARLDRALCLAALGRREEARRLLLRTGDSRFQEAVDKALERIGSR